MDYVKDWDEAYETAAEGLHEALVRAHDLHEGDDDLPGLVKALEAALGHAKTLERMYRDATVGSEP